MRRFRLRLCLALGKFQQAEKLWKIEACLCRVIVYKGIRRIEKQQLEHGHIAGKQLRHGVLRDLSAEAGVVGKDEAVIRRILTRMERFGSGAKQIG